MGCRTDWGGKTAASCNHERYAECQGVDFQGGRGAHCDREKHRCCCRIAYEFCNEGSYKAHDY